VTVPEANEVVVTESGAAMVNVKFLVAFSLEPEEVTRIMKLAFPVPVGVPLITPDDALSDKPAGNAPP